MTRAEAFAKLLQSIDKIENFEQRTNVRMCVIDYLGAQIDELKKEMK